MKQKGIAENMRKIDGLEELCRWVLNTNNCLRQNQSPLFQGQEVKQIISLVNKVAAAVKEEYPFYAQELPQIIGITFFTRDGMFYNLNTVAFGELYIIAKHLHIEPQNASAWLMVHPRIATINSSIKLYAVNEETDNYELKSNDIYDIDNDGNIEEKINYRSIDISLIFVWALLTRGVVHTEMLSAWVYHNPLVILSAVLLFIIFADNKNFSNKIINSFSAASFTVFLIHTMVMDCLYHFLHMEILILSSEEGALWCKVICRSIAPVIHPIRSLCFRLIFLLIREIRYRKIA